jgi:hypothetical protein
MSHHTLEELVELWKREKLTVEQMIGQLLQALLTQQQRMRELERRLPQGGDTPTTPPDAGRRR